MNKLFAVSTQREKRYMNHPLLLHTRSLVCTPKAYVKAWIALLGYGGNANRWAKEESFNPAWDERTAMMAAMVAPGSTVLEFGSGREQLERFLPPECHYQPSDLVARSPRTLVCDLNQELPVLTRHYDVIVFSGVIEYINDLDGLFRHARAHAKECIVSYATTDQLRCMATRLASGWVNHLSESALMQCFSQTAWRCEERKTWQSQTIYRLTAGEG